MPRWLADTVTRRLGVEQLTIDTSHSPFLSRPRELAELLVHATTTTADRPAGAPLISARNRKFPKPSLGPLRLFAQESYRPCRMTPLQSAAACRNLAAS